MRTCLHLQAGLRCHLSADHGRVLTSVDFTRKGAQGMGITLGDARANIGRGVVYRPTHDKVEQGVITEVGQVFVFVRYDGDQYSKATPPGSLEWLSRG